MSAAEAAAMCGPAVTERIHDDVARVEAIPDAQLDLIARVFGDPPARRTAADQAA